MVLSSHKGVYLRILIDSECLCKFLINDVFVMNIDLRKDLSGIVSCDLTWSFHINDTVSEAAQNF